jgi:hypothetical protein
MKLAAMQPYFFPYLGYFQLISAVDKFILYDNLNYIRHEWVSRNRLLPVHGQPTYFIVPLKEQSTYSKIRDILINNRTDWRRKICKQIELNYRRSPFFDEVYPLVEKALAGKEDHLTTLNSATIQLVCAFLELPTIIVTDISEYEALEIELSRSDSDVIAFYMRQQGLSDSKTIRVLEICNKEGAGTYINAIGGQALYDKQIFTRSGINLYFLQSLPYTYHQNSTEFYPGLSILDVLMNCGKAGTRRLLNKYELI